MVAQMDAREFLTSTQPLHLAVLAMSTPHQFGNEEIAEFGHGLAFDKSAYNWAAVITAALEKHLRKYGHEVDFDKQIDEAISHVEAYSSATKTGGMYKQSEIGLIKETFFRGGVGNAPTNRKIVSDIASCTSYLENQGLIKDPFVEVFGGLPLMVLGMLPVSFSRRTEEGDRTYLKISALLWEMENESTPTGSQFYFSFRVFKAVEYFKKRIRLEWKDRDPQ